MRWSFRSSSRARSREPPISAATRSASTRFASSCAAPGSEESPLILVVDNHDSFTWNLVHYLREAGATVRVERSDALPVEAAMASGADGILISPGPGRPEDGGISLALVKACAEAAMPLLGVCLGHQAIGQAFGGTIVRAPRVMHGKTSPVTHDGDGVFAGLPSPLTVARYHSLVIREDDMPGCLAVTARADDGTVQGVRHRALPIEGVQFHPESIASEHGHALLANFVRHAQAGTSRKDTVTPQKPLA